MRYRIECGEYRAVLERPSAKQAALDALQLWSYKVSPPPLSTLTSVILIPTSTEIFFLTNKLLGEI